MAAPFPLEVVLKANDRVSGPLARLRNNLLAYGNAFNTLGTRLTAGITMPLREFGRESARVAIQVDEALGHVRALTGVTGTAFDELKVSIRSAGEESAVGLVDAAEAMDALVSSTFSLDQAKRFLPDVLNLATGTRTAARETANLVAAVADAFEIGPEGTRELVDMLARGTIASESPFREFAGDLTAIGATAKAAGMDLGELVNVVAILKSASVSQPMRALRGLIERLADAAGPDGRVMPLDELVEQLNRSGARGVDVLGELGKQGAVLGVLMRKGADGIRNTSDGLERLPDAATQAERALSGPSGAMRRWHHEVELLQEQIGATQLLPALHRVAEVLGRVAHWFTELSPSTQDWLVKLAVGGAVMGPAIQGLTVMAKLVNDIRLAYLLAKVAAGGLAGTAAAAGGIPAGVGPAVAGGIPAGAAAGNALRGTIGTTIAAMIPPVAVALATNLAVKELNESVQDQAARRPYGEAWDFPDTLRTLYGGSLFAQIEENWDKPSTKPGMWEWITSKLAGVEPRAGGEASRVKVEFANTPAGTAIKAGGGVDVDVGYALNAPR